MPIDAGPLCDTRSFALIIGKIDRDMPIQCSQGAEIVGQVVTAGPRVYAFPPL